MIVYAVVAQLSSADSPLVLVESAAAGIEGNYPTVTQELLKVLKDRPTLISVGNRKTFVYIAKNNSTATDETVSCDPFEPLWSKFDEVLGVDSGDATTDMLHHYFHVLHGEEAIYVCLSDDKQTRRQNVNFGFLHDVQKEFTKKYKLKHIQKANAYGMEKTFSKTMINLMHHYNINGNELEKDERIATMTANVESLKSLMGDNIQLLLKRGDNLEQMVHTSDSLVKESQVFKRKARNLKKRIRHRKLYYKLFTAFILILIVYLIAASICGFGLSCVRNND